MNVETLSTTKCDLGEGPLWHPTREQLFWFDINGKRLLTIEDGAEREWSFQEHVSAAGWVDDRQLMIASEAMLFLFDLETGARQPIAALEADNPATRSNDGRADPQGGFWIGTMGKKAEEGAGSIWRWYRGELRQLQSAITIPNSICFAPSGDLAYWCDTATRQIMKQGLDNQGWPVGEPEIFVDLREEGLNPDGSVVDAAGNVWNAQWGASRVACYGPDGTFSEAISIPASQVSCPAFGGADLATLYVTTAIQGLEGEDAAGQTYRVATDHQGQREHRVLL